MQNFALIAIVIAVATSTAFILFNAEVIKVKSLNLALDSRFETLQELNKSIVNLQECNKTEIGRLQNQLESKSLRLGPVIDLLKPIVVYGNETKIDFVSGLHQYKNSLSIQLTSQILRLC